MTTSPTAISAKSLCKLLFPSRSDACSSQHLLATTLIPDLNRREPNAATHQSHKGTSKVSASVSHFRASSYRSCHCPQVRLHMKQLSSHQGGTDLITSLAELAISRPWQTTQRVCREVLQRHQYLHTEHTTRNDTTHPCVQQHVWSQT